MTICGDYKRFKNNCTYDKVRSAAKELLRCVIQSPSSGNKLTEKFFAMYLSPFAAISSATKVIFLVAHSLCGNAFCIHRFSLPS